jgi:RHS repeat-associated protein
MRRRLAGCLLLLLCPAAAALAAGPPSTLPAGMGKYIMVLWPPGTPVPGGGPVVTMKNVPEPDIEQRGGKLLAKFDNRRLIQLPLAAATELRRHEAVAFLQRVWTGESLEGWDERYVPPPPPAKGHMHVAPQDDANLTWGPKSYAYDGSGNIKTVGSDAFAYDSAGRLIQATVNSTAGAVSKTESYKYDAFGNLIEKAVSGTNPVAIPVDPGSNRVQGVSYDPAGNATTSKDARWAYKYDSLNMMTGVKATPCCVNRRMIYDASDERIGTFLINDNPVRWTFRDFEGRVIREYTSVKTGLEFGMWTWEQDYFYGESGLIGGETQDYGYTAANRYGGRRHYHLDHLGNVRMVTTDATGTTRARSIAENDYYPFGTTMTRTYQEQVNWGDPHIDAMRFAGHWRDFLGLLNVDNTDYIDYMHARYYDPNGGRFLSVDPVGGTAHVPQSWNKYAYALNSPLRFNDPSGTESCTVVWLGAEPHETCLTEEEEKKQRLDEIMTQSTLEELEDLASTGYQFIAGASNAYASDMLLGMGRQSADDDAYQWGQIAGDIAAMGQGLNEMIGGATGEVGGFLLDLVPGGFLVGVPVNVASGAVGVHGAAVTVVGTWHAMSGIKQRKEGKHGTFRGRESKRANDAAFHRVCRELGLDKDQQTRLHHEIGGGDLSYEEIKRVARSIFHQ